MTQAVPASWFPGPSSAFLAVALEVFRPAPGPAFLRKRVTLPRLRTLFRDPVRSRPLARSTEVGRAQGSSLEVLHPFSGHESASRRLPGSTRAPSLLGLSQTLEGFILADPCGFVSRRCRSWGSTLQSFSLASELFRARRPAIPSRRFSASPKDHGRALRGLCPLAVRIRTGRVSSQFEPMLSWAFQASTALRLSGIPVSRRFIRS